MMNINFNPVRIFGGVLVVFVLVFVVFQVIGNIEHKKTIKELQLANELRQLTIRELAIENNKITNKMEAFRDTVMIYEARNYDLYQEARKIREDFNYAKTSHEREVTTLRKLHEKERESILNIQNEIIYEN